MIKVLVIMSFALLAACAPDKYVVPSRVSGGGFLCPYNSDPAACAFPTVPPSPTVPPTPVGKVPTVVGNVVPDGVWRVCGLSFRQADISCDPPNVFVYSFQPRPGTECYLSQGAFLGQGQAAISCVTEGNSK